MSTFAIQYLEPGPHITQLSSLAVREKLRAAFERLPIDMVLIGWRLPDPLVDVCAEECQQAGAELYRWHPLLTGDGRITPVPTWQVIGQNGKPVPGFRGMPEFTFMCPNRPDVRAAVLANLRTVLRDDRFDGVFLDRIRFPSPAENLEATLGCFCEDCQRLAAIRDLDLAAVRQCILRLTTTQEGCEQLVAALLDPATTINCPERDLAAFSEFLRFRFDTITKYIRQAAELIHEQNMAVGMDCFTPSLTATVGQDLAGLDSAADWIKPMAYAHTNGPAGMVYEFAGLLHWLTTRGGLSEPDAMSFLTHCTKLPLPATREALLADGLPTEALRQEAVRACATGVRKLLMGMELVEIPGVAELTPARIAEDAAALRDGGADGLVLSWDLWHMPLERLDTIREAWDA